MPYSVDESYRHCIQVARTEARNFYYSFLCLPAPKRAAMCAIYAFMRYSDDVSDDGGEQAAKRMAEWRGELDRALSGDYGESPVFPAFHDAVRRYGIPARYFHEVIDGTEMDLRPRRFETFDETYRYCYLVASVVGLVCIHVFGFSDRRALELAESNGIAFQLTNILRDLREDAEMGRVYLPQEDLRRFGYTEAELRGGVDNAAFRELMRFQVERARDYYDRSAPLVELVDADSRPCLRAMRRIYGGILERIVAQEYDVFSRRARVPTWKKLWIATEAWWQSRLVSRQAAHGTS
ncbi:MAG: phytoene/squalene synthase family protein [Armatimonadota bacterium]